MNARLVLAIVSTLLEEVAILVIALLGLPKLGVHIPLAGIIAFMVAWLTYSVAVYRMGSRALRRKPVVSLPDMVGGRGKIVSPLVPEGLVKIKGELWVAISVDKNINVGTDVLVVEQDGLKLVVRESNAGDLEGTK